jgi:hypothetical protein
MKILMYSNRKNDVPLCYDISTPEREAAGYLLLFGFLKDEWQVYVDLEEDEDPSVCEACSDGAHKYCTGNDGLCACSRTTDCARRNDRLLRERKANEIHRSLYNRAEAGDWKAAKKLMVARKDYEYEEVSEVVVIDPTEKKGKQG